MSTEAFELSLSAALRDEAEEISMSTDLNEGRARLDQKLDTVDAARRRRTWTAGLAAVAATAVVVGIVIGVSRPSAAPPADSSPTPQPSTPVTMAVSTSTMTPNFAVDLPYWTAFVHPGSAPSGLIMYADVKAGCDFGCPDDQDRMLLMIQPRAVYAPGDDGRATVRPTAQQVVDGWLAVQEAGYGTVLEAPTATAVGGRPAISLTVRVDKQLPGVVGCEDESLPSCVQMPPGRTVRVTAVDTGDGFATVFYFARNTANPDSAAVASDLDTVVRTVVWS